MNIRHMLTLGILGSILLTGTAFAQQIQTNTSATTQGSTTFGYLPNAADLGVFMQTTVAPTCTTVSTNVQTCTSDGGTAVGDNDNFVRVDQMPGSFTDSPIPGTISATPNFACGALAVNSNDCQLTMTNINEALGDQQQTAPNFGILGAPRDLVGNLNTRITLGDGSATAGMPDGFIAFTLDPSTGDATIDQFITHTVSLGGADLMIFNQRDVTIALGTVIPDPIGGALTLLPFTALNTPTLGAVIGGTQLPMDMVSRMTLAQGPADGFGSLNLDVQVNWTGELVGIQALTNLPFSGTMVTPGLNTGIDPQPFFGAILAPEFNGFAFP